jgi:hypothetical protein
MTQTARQGMGTAGKVAVAVLAGLVAFLLLIPSGGTDGIPPQCTSIFNLYGVPCDGWVAPAAAVATAAIVYLALSLRDRRR